jgi:DNA-binding IclR family transcriptional regulator
VTALLKKGYLIQKEKRGKYSLGLKFLNFSYFIQKNTAIASAAFPFLLELRKEANESVTLAILDGHEILVIERLDVSADLRVSGAVGKRAPLHTAAIGKLYVTQMSKTERAELFKGPSIIGYTKHTITDLAEMEKEIEKIKAEGCAYDREEMAIGIWSVAAPIYGIKGNIEAGVATIAPTVRIDKAKSNQLTVLTKAYAARISRELGYRAK